MKRLFGMSSNQCAMPDCHGPLIINDIVVGEICHIRAKRKGGPRHDPTLTPAQKDDYDNLILFCSTCHKLVDSSPGEYTPEWLKSIKSSHERKAPLPLDLSIADVRNALLILSKHIAKSDKGKNGTGKTSVSGSVSASASHSSVSVAIGGANQGPIHIKVPAPKSGPRPYPANSIGADANMTNYVEYLCELYVKYMIPIERDENASWAKLGKHIKSKFHLKKKTRNHLSAERFWDLVNFLVDEKLALTPVGRKHLRQGTKLCRTFEEYRHGQM